MIARLVGRFRGHTILGALYALGMKASGSIAALVMFALSSWTMGISDFGELAVVFAVVSLAAVISVLGQDILIQRAWGEYVGHRPDLAAGALRFGLAVTSIGALVSSSLFVVVAHRVDGRLTAPEILAAGAFLFSQTGLHFTSNVARVVCGTRVSEAPRELFWRLPLVVAAGAAAVSDGHMSIALFFTTAAAAQILSIAHLALRIGAALPPALRAARPTCLVGVWARRSLSMWLAALAEAGHQYADLILIGHFLGSSAAAGYFVIMRIAAIFSMLAGGIHNYATAKISTLYFAGRLAELRRLIAHISMLTLGATTAAFLPILFAGPLLLSVFGPEYRGLQTELILMCVILAVQGLAWPGPTLMLFMGADALYMKLVGGALVVRIAALVALAPTFEIRGAIGAVALSLIPMVIAVSAICIRRFGIDPTVASIVTAPLLAGRDAERQAEIARRHGPRPGDDERRFTEN